MQTLRNSLQKYFLSKRNAFQQNLGGPDSSTESLWVEIPKNLVLGTYCHPPDKSAECDLDWERTPKEKVL